MRDLALKVGVLATLLPSLLWAGGTSLKVLEHRTWVQHVLTAEAPGMSERVRQAVARTVAEECHAHQLDPALVLALMKVESRYRPTAKSPKGARGLMQVMPAVAQQLMGQEFHVAQLHDPETNVRLGVALLRSFITRHGDLYAGLAAYNMGSKKVRGHLRTKEHMHARDFIYTRQVLAEFARLKNGFPRQLLGLN